MRGLVLLVTLACFASAQHQALIDYLERRLLAIEVRLPTPPCRALGSRVPLKGNFQGQKPMECRCGQILEKSSFSNVRALWAPWVWYELEISGCDVKTTWYQKHINISQEMTKLPVITSILFNFMATFLLHNLLFFSSSSCVSSLLCKLGVYLQKRISFHFLSPQRGQRSVSAREPSWQRSSVLLKGSIWAGCTHICHVWAEPGCLKDGFMSQCVYWGRKEQKIMA